MNKLHLIAGIAALASIMQLHGCSSKSEASNPDAVQHARVEPVGEGISRITLSEEAAKRLRLEFAEAKSSGERLVLPYNALLYDPNGTEWVYVSESPTTFRRTAVKVDVIEGDDVYYAGGQGPASGQKLVTMGATELFGIEYGVGQ